LRLGVIPTLAPYLFAACFCHGCRRDHPDLNLDLLETQTKILLAEFGHAATLDVLLMGAFRLNRRNSRRCMC